MHCPRCGTSATAGQQFCRACGLSLEKVAEILGEDLPVQSSNLTERDLLRLRQQRFEHWAGVAGLGTFGVILLLLMILVFSQMILRGGWLAVPGTLLILLAVGAGTMAFFQGYAKNLKAKLEEKPLPPSTEPLSNRTTTLPLPPNSVSERTTELLAPAPSKDTGEI